MLNALQLWIQYALTKNFVEICWKYNVEHTNKISFILNFPAKTRFAASVPAL